MDGGGVSTHSDDGAPVSPTTQQSSDGGGGGSSGAQQSAPHTLWRERGVRLLSYVIGLDGPVERDVSLLLVQYALWASCMLVLNKAAVGSLSNPTVLLVVQLTIASAAVPVMQVATPVSLRVARVLPGNIPRGTQMQTCRNYVFALYSDSIRLSGTSFPMMSLFNY